MISNVGGGSKSSSADKEGSVEYLSPEESLAKIKVPEGFELNVFASERSVSRSGQSRADAGRCQGSTVGGLLEHLSQVGTAARR